jgi:polyphosphate kinase
VIETKTLSGKERSKELDIIKSPPEIDSNPDHTGDDFTINPMRVTAVVATLDIDEPVNSNHDSPGADTGKGADSPAETGRKSRQKSLKRVKSAKTPKPAQDPAREPKPAESSPGKPKAARSLTDKPKEAKGASIRPKGAKNSNAKAKAAKGAEPKPKALKSATENPVQAKSDRSEPKAAKLKTAKSLEKTKLAKPKLIKPKAVKLKAVKPKAVKKHSVKGKKHAPESGSEFDLNDSQWYLNRELTWLEFNRRVLNEATDERTPLLERLKFIAIVSANIDEFVMKRIGGLKQQIGAGMHELTLDGRTPRQQVVECHASIREIHARKREAFNAVRALLEQKGIVIESYEQLSPKEKKQLREQYYKNIYPLLTPQSIDPAHPFPFISNLSLNLLVTLRYPNAREVSLARIKVPVGLGTSRFLRVGSKGDHFVPLEEVMMHNLDLLFPGMHIVACETFRVTRNANTEKDEEEADDLMAMIESELKERKFAPIVRLEIVAGMEPLHRGRLAAELDLDEVNDVFEVHDMLAMRDLFEISRLDYPRLHDPPHHPVDHPQLLTSRNIFHTIRDNGNLLLQHPYVSFSSSVERFLREAATDPKVRGIKMTLYRTSSQSRIIDALLQAAQNGKQVAVVVELKARFDEATNIRLAEQMEEAGIHVTYGVVGLKTHCKVILVVRQDYQGLRRYVHIGTGNYHAETARIYSDIGLITCDDTIAQDVTELFNYLTTGFSARRNYRAVVPAPKLLKKSLLMRIEREAALHAESGGGLIQFKMNALEDGEIVKALYRASMAGVKIDLYVRDTCRLRPGIPGLSENIRVVSVVGRFLEHARLYYFRNGGAEEYFIASADAMKRNLEARVEVMCPVTVPELTRELRAMLDCYEADHRSAWDMGPDGSYKQRQPAEGEPGEGTQQMLIALAQKRLKESLKQKKKPMHHR